jgi:hypothetical protein
VLVYRFPAFIEWNESSIYLLSDHPLAPWLRAKSYIESMMCGTSSPKASIRQEVTPCRRNDKTSESILSFKPNV